MVNEILKYKIKYKRKDREKNITGYLRIPRDVPEQFTTDQLIAFLCEKHKSIRDQKIEITLPKYFNGNLNYENTLTGAKELAQKAANQRN